MNRWLRIASLALLAIPARSQETPRTISLTAPQNILLLVTDDIGVDMVPAYGIGSAPPPMPTLDWLTETGVRFDAAFGNPICSPTRATILTGRYSFRTGIGVLVTTTSHALQLDETTLPEMLDVGTSGRYAHAAFGKWHLSNDSVGGIIAPNLAGYDHWSGFFGPTIGRPHTPYLWPKVTNGQISMSTTYVTTEQVDQTLDWIRGAPEPWFVHVEFNAAHGPRHAPPAHLHSYDLPNTYPEPGEDELPYYYAMAEALDREMGRLFDELGPELLARTTILFVSDNGTPEDFVQPPHVHGKGELTDGGVQVPLLVRGPLVADPGRHVDALVNTTDLYATIADLAGVDLDEVGLASPDSRSFVRHLRDANAEPVRSWVYAELFAPNGPSPEFTSRMIRNERLKLMERREGQAPATYTVFDLVADPYELAPIVLAGLGAQNSVFNDSVRAGELEYLRAELGRLVAPPFSQAR